MLVNKIKTVIPYLVTLTLTFAALTGLMQVSIPLRSFCKVDYSKSLRHLTLQTSYHQTVSHCQIVSCKL